MVQDHLPFHRQSRAQPSAESVDEHPQEGPDCEGDGFAKIFH
ncbi:MAG: hypothetical protein ACRCXH_07455 [Shewanella sp.]